MHQNMSIFYNAYFLRDVKKLMIKFDLMVIQVKTRFVCVCVLCARASVCVCVYVYTCAMLYVCMVWYAVVYMCGICIY